MKIKTYKLIPEREIRKGQEVKITKEQILEMYAKIKNDKEITGFFYPMEILK